MSSAPDILNLMARGGACILAGVPSTTLVPLPLTRLLTRRFRREDLLKRLHLMVPWATFCRRHILEIDLHVSGREHLPRPSRGHMFVSNHQSYVDILVLIEALGTIAFLSKQLIRRIPVIGSCAHAGGTVFFDRRGAGSRQRALDETLRMCRESTAVVVFPEGTRSADGNLQPRLHPRAMEAAHDTGLKILPVGLDGTHRVVPKSNDRIATGQRVAVSIGEALDPHDYPDHESWVQAVWGRVSELHLHSRRRLQELGG